MVLRIGGIKLFLRRCILFFIVWNCYLKGVLLSCKIWVKINDWFGKYLEWCINDIFVFGIIKICLILFNVCLMSSNLYLIL